MKRSGKVTLTSDGANVGTQQAEVVSHTVREETDGALSEVDHTH